MKCFDANKKIMKVRRLVKGVSPVLAVLLMIAIAVIAAIVAYMWVMGYLRFTTNKTSKAIQIQSVGHTGTILLVYVQNVGEGTVRFVRSQCLYVDAVLQPSAGIDLDTLETGETATIDASSTVALGQTIKIKVVTDEGTFSEGSFTITEFTGEYTITASAETGGTISPSGPVIVGYGVDQSFTITPDIGHYISDVMVDGSSISAQSSYTFHSVASDHTIHASFAANTYTIAASASLGGSISPSGDVTVDYGSDQTFTLTPDTGYHVVDVTVDAVSQGPVGSYTFTYVVAGHTIHADFSINTYTITASADDHGTIDPLGSVPVGYGDDQTFTFTADTGYHVSDVVVDSTSLGPMPSYTFTGVVMDHTIHVDFAINTFTIIASVDPGAHGSISPLGTVTLSYGDDQTFTFTADTGYHVSDVVVDSTSLGPSTSYTFYFVTTSHTIYVDFAADTYTITVTAGSGGSIIPPGPSVIVNYGADQAFTISPVSDYHILDVVVDSVSQGAIASYTFTDVQADHTISATFAINTYPIIVSFGSFGTITPSGPIVYVEHGADQTFIIAPDTGYHVGNVDVDGVLQGPITSYTFYSVTASHSISATFAINTYTITATAGSGGSISPLGLVSVNYGASQAFTITASSGYTIADVVVDGASQGAIGSYTFNSVQADHTISATFTQTASKLVYTAGASQSLTVGQVSSVITVQRQDSSGNPVTGEGTITVSLTTSTPSTGRFYSDAGGTIQITSVQISIGQSSASFYYSDTAAGTPTLTASSGSLTPATATFTINNYKLAFTAGAGQTLYTGATSQQITVQRQNADGSQRRYVTGITVVLTTSSSGGKFYSNAGGTTEITSVYIGYSSSTAFFYYKDTSVGTPTLTASSSGYTPATTLFTIQLPTSKLVYTAGAPQTLSVDAMSSQITVRRQDQNDIPITSGTTTVDLTSSSLGGRFYSNAGGTNEITSVNISPGSSTANFYYRDFAAGSPTLTASSVGFISATSQFTINGQSEPHYNTTVTPDSVGAGTTVSFTYRITLDTSQDVDIGYVNVTIPAGFTGISVTSVTSNVGTWDSSVSGNVITLTADSFGDELEDRGDWVQVVFTATAPSSAGTYQFTSVVYEHLDLSGIGQGTNTGSDPSVNVYIPVTFGNDQQGSNYQSIEDRITGGQFVCSQSGTAQSITAYIIVSSTHNIKAAIYTSTGTLVGSTEERSISTSNDGWVTFNFLSGSKPALTAGTTYTLVVWSNSVSGSANLYYSSSGGTGTYNGRTYGSWPNSVSFSSDGSRNYSIYCSCSIP